MLKWKFKFGRSAKLALGFIVSAVFVYLIAAKLEWEFVVESVSKAKWEWLALAPIWLLGNIYFRIVRWWLLLRVKAPALTFRACIWPYILGAWLNIVIPFRAGDFVRAFGFRKQQMSPTSRILGLLVLERVLDLLAVLVVFFIGIVEVVNSKVIPEAFSTAAVIIAALAVLGLACLIFLNRPMRYLVQLVTGLPPINKYELSQKIRLWMDHFFDGVSIIRRPSIFVSVVSVTAVLWFLEGFTYYLVAIAIGAAEPPIASWFSFATAALATAIPSTPGFVGTFDYFAALGMSAFGVDWNTATVFAVIVHIVLVLPYAVIMLVYGGFKLAGSNFFTGGQLPDNIETGAPGATDGTDGSSAGRSIR